MSKIHDYAFGRIWNRAQGASDVIVWDTGRRPSPLLYKEVLIRVHIYRWALYVWNTDTDEYVLTTVNEFIINHNIYTNITYLLFEYEGSKRLISSG